MDVLDQIKNKRLLSATEYKFFTEDMKIQLVVLAKIGKDVTTLRPIAELHEDHGDVLLWRVPICEPPDVGSCLDCDFDESKYTHWSVIAKDLEEAAG